jgi:alcohol dehydrogenase
LIFNFRHADCIEQVRTLTNGGADFTFEFAGVARALENAYAMTRRGGTTVTAGLPPPDATLGVNIVGLVAEERTLKGSYIGSCVPQRDIPKFIQWYREGRLPVDALLAERLRLDELNEGFDRLATGHTTRQVVVFD